MVSFSLLRVFGGAGVVLILGSVMAEARPSVYTMSCSQARAFVQRQGAVVANTGTNTFERIVANGSFCDREQITKPFYGKTRDVSQCNIGFRCASRPMTAH